MSITLFIPGYIILSRGLESWAWVLGPPHGSGHLGRDGSSSFSCPILATFVARILSSSSRQSENGLPPLGVAGDQAS